MDPGMIGDGMCLIFSYHLTRQIGDEVGAGGVGQNEFNCTILGKIGEGTYDLIFLVRTESPAVTHSKFVGIKKFKQSKDGNDISPTAIREIMLLKKITHENVVKLINIHINHVNMSLYLAFNYVEHNLYVDISFHREAFFLFVECEINCYVKCGRKLLGITWTNSTIRLINTLLSLCYGSCSMD
ncbi:hypothetical protein JHK87_012139 [Glycine soja]|nr:hypothetical protein JHK87_012139 [Glycine soja]